MSENKLVNASIIFIGLIFLFMVLYQFQTFLRPFVIAIILSFLFVPFTRMSKEKKKSIWLITSFITVVLLFFVIFLSAIFVDESIEEEPQNEVRSSLEELLTVEPIQLGENTFDLKNIVDPAAIATSVANLIRGIISSLGAFLSEALLALLFLFFLLPTHDSTIEKISSSLDRKQKDKFQTALVQIEQAIRDYLSIKSLVSLLTALLSAIVMFIFGTKFIVLFAILIFFLNFIPTIGSIVAVVAVLAIHLVTAPFTPMFFLFAILMILIQIIVGSVIEPQFAGKKLNLSPVVILLALFFWGSIWGIGGMFFAVPLTSIIRIVLSHNEDTKGFVSFLS
jgi:predicted PurR-regulated permease PerM